MSCTLFSRQSIENRLFGLKLRMTCTGISCNMFKSRMLRSVRWRVSQSCTHSLRDDEERSTLNYCEKDKSCVFINDEVKAQHAWILLATRLCGLLCKLQSPRRCGTVHKESGLASWSTRIRRWIDQIAEGAKDYLRREVPLGLGPIDILWSESDSRSWKDRIPHPRIPTPSASYPGIHKTISF